MILLKYLYIPIFLSNALQCCGVGLLAYWLSSADVWEFIGVGVSITILGRAESRRLESWGVPPSPLPVGLGALVLDGLVLCDWEVPCNGSSNSGAPTSTGLE
jgi:hypothetical protein